MFAKKAMPAKKNPSKKPKASKVAKRQSETTQSKVKQAKAKQSKAKRPAASATGLSLHATNERFNPLVYAKRRVREIPDFPIPGILFRDITPVLADARAFHAV